MRRIVAVALAFALAACAPSPRPQGDEAAFVAGIQHDLSTRFATAADARRSGYFRYTDEDATGAISYANLQWRSDPQHPSQLWYGVDGKLLGADFSVPRDASKVRPNLWGIDTRRWQDFDSHVHYVLAGPGGAEVYGYVTDARFEGAGGKLGAPDAATLVKMGMATSVKDVKHVFFFPSIWDLIVWIAPNPEGAFAEKNPLVKPSRNAKDMM